MLPSLDQTRRDRHEEGTHDLTHVQQHEQFRGLSTVWEIDNMHIRTLDRNMAGERLVRRESALFCRCRPKKEQTAGECER